jgi:flagellar export protein FliJ
VKRFRFALDRVLRQRELQEDLAEQALARTLTEERVAGEELSRVAEQAAREAIGLRQALSHSLSGADVALHVRFAAALRGRHAKLHARREIARAQLRESRERLQERRRAREAVDQLKRAAWDRYCRAAEREAQVALDEVAGGRHERRRADTEES